jgi:ABC-type glutathione transport system ATPase component
MTSRTHSRASLRKRKSICFSCSYNRTQKAGKDAWQVSDATLELASREIMGIVGHSGSCKTSFCLSLIRLRIPTRRNAG